VGLGVQQRDAESAAAMVQTISYSPVAPSSIDLRWPSAPAPIWLIVGLEGDRESVRARADRLRELVGPALLPELPPDLARVRQLLSSGHESTTEANAPVSRSHNQLLADLRDPAADKGTLVRVAFWVGQLARVLTTIRTAGVANEVEPAITGSAGAGILDVTLDAGSDDAAVARFVAELRAGLTALGADGVLPSVASAVVLYAPDEVRKLTDAWGPASSLGLMRSIKDQFDPEHRMAPGRFAGGI
jgi:glycolate oxidase FAD binding subunit